MDSISIIGAKEGNLKNITVSRSSRLRIGSSTLVRVAELPAGKSLRKGPHLISGKTKIR